ncbi:34273_t:CDS:2, partial [Racocetra persica]
MSTTSETHEIDSNLDIIKNTLGVIGAIRDAAQPYLSLISTVTTIIAEIFNIYENVQYNKNIFKEKFGSLINEFKTTMNDLYFATTLFNDEQREIDARALKSDLEEMSKFLETIISDVIDANQNINNVLKEVLIIKNQLRFQNSITKNIRATEIEPRELNDPQIGKSTDTQANKESPLVKKLLNEAIE